MKISTGAINNHNQFQQIFKSITIKDFNSKYNGKRGLIINEIEKFSNKPYSLTKIGEGVNGETFKFSNSQLSGIVIKSPKAGIKEDYQAEFEHLMQIPVDKIGGQEAVARIYDSKKGCYYLLSTLVKGNQISHSNSPKKEHLRVLFNKMFELDKHGIYHGDLNGKNILLNSDGNVNFIDYQWAEFVPKNNFFDSVKMEKVLLPVDALIENAQMFEMATMPWYIDTFQYNRDKMDFLKEYLQVKSAYHTKRADYIGQLLSTWSYSSEKANMKKCIHYERAKSSVYRNPSDDILRLEMKKIQFLSDYRDAYMHVDPNCINRNILASPSAYLCAISAVQDFRKDISKELLKANDSDKKTYLHSLEDYGAYWYNNLLNYCNDTFAYIMRVTQKQYFDYETPHQFYINDRNPREFSANRDILSPLPYMYRPHYEKNFNTPQYMSQDLQTNLYYPISKLKRDLKDTKSQNNIQKVSDLYIKSNKFVNSGQSLDLLNTSNLTVLKVREFCAHVRHNVNSYNARYVLENMLEQTVYFTQSLFDTIFDGLSEFYSRNIIVQGYENMRHFKAKI